MKRPCADKQGQYLAFVYYYGKIHGSPPSESEMQRYFKVSLPSGTANDLDTRNPRLYRAQTWTGSIHPSADSTRRATRLDLACLLHACKLPTVISAVQSGRRIRNPNMNFV
jgi:hypothetical protein